MKAILKFKQLLVALFFLILCVTNINAADNIKTIKIGEALRKQREVKLSKYAKSIRYIKLDNNIFLPGLAKRSNFCVLNDEIFIIPIGFPEKALYKFDINGKILSSNINRGRRESEYYQIMATAISPDAGDILILEFNRILKFDRLGNYKGSIFLQDKFGPGARFHDLLYGGDSNIYLLWIDIDKIYNVSCISLNGEVLSTQKISYAIHGTNRVSVINGKKGYGAFSACLFNDEDVCFISEISETISQIDKEKRSVKYRIDWGDYIKTTLLNDASNLRMPGFSRTLNTKNLYSPNLIFFDYTLPLKFDPTLTHKERFTGVIYDKIKGETISPKYDRYYESFGLTNDIDDGAPFWPIFVTKKKMYQLIEAIDFIEMAEKSTSARMKDVAAQLTEESNPVVVEVTLK